MVRVIILVIYHSIEIKMTAVKQSFFPFRDSGGIQTHNLLIRSQMLYSVELRNLLGSSFLICGCKGTDFF